MKRLYLSPYTTRTIAGQTSYVPLVSTYPLTAYSSISPTAPNAPGGWALCIVEALDHAPMLADPALAPLPDYPPDGSYGSMSAEAKAQLQAAMTKFNISLTPAPRNTDGYRSIVRRVGQVLASWFNENTFDAAVS